MLLLMLFLAICAWRIADEFPGNVREYRLYLLEDRKPIDFRYEELSAAWTEADLKARFPRHTFDCFDNRPGEYLDERSCFTDIGAHNDQAAMFAAFYFAGGGLRHAAISMPSWKYAANLSKPSRLLTVGRWGYSRPKVVRISMDGSWTPVRHFSTGGNVRSTRSSLLPCFG